jgi:serine/threonine protein kinase
MNPHTAGALPEKIGPYAITGQIGSGGMATVYRAVHPEDGRAVALKVLAIHLADHEDVRRRFEREANTLLQFKHPHILPVYDFGEDDGTPYLVMKLMSGWTLRDLLRGQPLRIEEVGRYTRQIASALDYAHARGIVHRDVKPANILLDQASIPYLADFGVAYWTAEADGSARLTQEGDFVGTVGYASPEQCEGKKLDRPSDIYALAVMVFQMATGHLPFESSSPIAVIKMHLRDAPPNPLALNPALPMALYNVLVKALAKLPENRHPSAMKFSEAVDEALGLYTRPQFTGGDDWLYDDIKPVSPDGLAAWTTATDQPASAGETPALTNPSAFDAGVDYDGPADPFADLEMEEVVAHLSEAEFDNDFDDQFDLEEPADDRSAGLVDNFADENGIASDDDFPGPSLVLDAMPKPASPSPVIRPIHSVKPVQPAAPKTFGRRSVPRTLIVAAILLALELIAAGSVLIYDALHDSPTELNATYRSDTFGVIFDYPDHWSAVPADGAVLSATPVPTILLSDQPVIPGETYAGASIVIAVQHIDPIEVFGVPAACEDRASDGPVQTFDCMEGLSFATPVYRLFDTPLSAEGVWLPGTLPPARASLPAILLPTGQAQWLALVIIHWDSYDGAQDMLARIARSVRPSVP